MRDVQVARLALFHGDPEKAKELTNEASALLSVDSTEWAKFAKPGKKTNLNDDQYIVINASVGISESYVATPEKEAAIKIANEKMAKGDKKGAMEELRLAGVGVMENQYLMPLNRLVMHLLMRRNCLIKSNTTRQTWRLKVRKMESSSTAKHCL